MISLLHDSMGSDIIGQTEDKSLNIDVKDCSINSKSYFIFRAQNTGLSIAEGNQ